LGAATTHCCPCTCGTDRCLKEAAPAGPSFDDKIARVDAILADLVTLRGNYNDCLTNGDAVVA